MSDYPGCLGQMYSLMPTGPFTCTGMHCGHVEDCRVASTAWYVEPVTLGRPDPEREAFALRELDQTEVWYEHTRQWVAFYRARGWKVAPATTQRLNADNRLPVLGCCTCKAGSRCKAPGKHALRYPNWLSAFTDRDKPCNIIIQTGPAVVVLEVDPRNGGVEALARLGLWEVLEGLRTPQVRSGGGGRHIYFQPPQGILIPSRTIGPGVEVKGHTGKAEIIAPPSLHASGKRYEWICDPSLALATIPARLMNWFVGQNGVYHDLGLEPPRHKLGVSLGVEGEPISEGCRKNTLWAMARTMYRNGVPMEQAYANIVAVNESRCRPSLDERTALRQVDRAYTWQPRTPRPPQLGLGRTSPTWPMQKGCAR